MKKSLIIIIATGLLMACGTKDPKAQLEKLTKQKSELEAQIAALRETLSKTDTSDTKKLTDVVAIPVKASIFKTYIEVQGRVDAEESVALSTEMPGTITKINVGVGERVNKGQILAETDARTIQQQLLEVETNLLLATQLYMKQEELWKQKIGTEMQYLSAKATKESLEKRVATLQEQLKMTKIISPIDGTVDGLNIKIGQAVSPGQAAINVVNFSDLKVKADVAESYAARVKNGNEVLVFFPDMNDTVVSKIHYASRAINNLTRTFAVEVKLDSKKEFHPNQVTKLRINDYQSPKPVIAIPVKYVQKTTTANYVVLAKNGKAVKQTVTLGREYNGVAEVTSGLNEGDLMITQGYDLVNENEAIHVK